ncbi:MAG TPA: SIS domain-containing protein [Dermatophilaceae bacterium]|jgi:fructoselysine-6-P-deglycase FrlB-like protein|nr:SIS domain-containing protein [Dermatophilaceae bacterium]
MPRWDDRLVDDEAERERLDSRGTLRALATAGAQVRQSLGLAQEAGIARVAGGVRPRGVLVAARGGTGVIGDTLQMVAEPGSPVPISTAGTPPLPGWVGTLDLVIAVSESGRAAGPLALAAAAARRGASLLTVGADDSPLAAVCASARGIHVGLPAGATSSRTALWALLTPVLLAADVLGLARTGPDLLEAVADRLDAGAAAYRPSSEAFVNPAKLLAADLSGGLPVVLGDGAVAGVAARRAAMMLARTARVPATVGELPGGASEVVALLDGPYTRHGAREPDLASAVDDIFRDPFLDGAPDPRLVLLMLRGALAAGMTPAGVGGSMPEDTDDLGDAVATAAMDAGVRVHERRAEPGHPLEQLADLIGLVDFAATYLALGLGLDPGVSAHVRALRDHGR